MKSETVIKINSIIKKMEKESKMHEPGTYSSGINYGFIRGLKMAKRIIQINDLITAKK